MPDRRGRRSRPVRAAVAVRETRVRDVFQDASPATRHGGCRFPKRDTAPELAVRRAAHALGLRYFVYWPPLRGVRRRADLVFPRLRIAVFVDGCFWHGCPGHGNRPRHTGDWWRAKIERNRRP